LLDPDYLAEEIGKGRARHLLERFAAVRRALIEAGETTSPRPPWAFQSVSRNSQTVWDRTRIEREIRRIQRRPTLPDRLWEMETFLAREWLPLTRHAAVPGFFRRHLAHFAGTIGGKTEKKPPPPADANLFLQPNTFPGRPRFPALIGVLDTGPEKICSLAAAADGAVLLTVDPRHGAVLRCGTTGRIRHALPGTAHPATAASLSGDGRWAAVRRGKDRVAVYDARNGARVLSAPCAGSFRLGGNGRRLLWQHPSGHLVCQNLSPAESPLTLWNGNPAGKPLALAVSRDGRRAISAPRSPGKTDSKSAPASVAAGESRPRPEDIPSAASGPVSSSGGAASAASRFPIHVWDLESGQCLRQLAAPGEGARFLEMSSDGRVAVSVGDDRELRIWDCRSGQGLGRIPLPRETITALALSPRGRMALTAHSMGTLAVWDLRRRRLFKRMQTHFGSIRQISLVRSGKRAFALGGDGRIRRLDIQRGEASGRPVHRSVQFLETSPDGKFAAGAGCLHFHRREFRIWALPGGSPAARRTNLPALPFRGAAISPGGNLALAVQPGSVRGWRLPSGDLEFQWEFDEPIRIARGCFAGNRVVLLAREQYVFAGTPGERRPSMLTGDVLALAPFPDSRHLLTLAVDRGVEIWDLQRRVRAGRLANSRDVREMALSPAGNWLAEITRRGWLRVRNLRTGETFFPLGGRVLAGPQIRFSPDGRRLAVAGETRDAGDRPESRLFTMDLGGGEGAVGPKDGLAIPLPFRRPMIRITPNGGALAAAEAGGREVHLFHLENGERIGCVCLPADSASVTLLGDFGADGALPAALQDGRVIFLGAGMGYETARPASPMPPAELGAVECGGKVPLHSVGGRDLSGGEGGRSVLVRRRFLPKRRNPVIKVSSELEAAIFSG
jgi:WD40 repeat protein